MAGKRYEKVDLFAGKLVGLIISMVSVAFAQNLSVGGAAGPISVAAVARACSTLVINALICFLAFSPDDARAWRKIKLGRGQPRSLAPGLTRPLNSPPKKSVKM